VEAGLFSYEGKGTSFPALSEQFEVPCVLLLVAVSALTGAYGGEVPSKSSAY
jgi:hypothetical protein